MLSTTLDALPHGKLRNTLADAVEAIVLQLTAYAWQWFCPIWQLAVLSGQIGQKWPDAVHAAQDSLSRCEVERATVNMRANNCHSCCCS